MFSLKVIGRHDSSSLSMLYSKPSFPNGGTGIASAFQPIPSSDIKELGMSVVDPNLIKIDRTRLPPQKTADA